MIKHSSRWLIGQDPFRNEDLWQVLYRYTYWRAGPIYRTALGALDIALWDLKGKALGVQCTALSRWTIPSLTC